MSKILHLTRDFPPRDNGGISTAVASIVRLQRIKGDDITLCSFDSWRPTRAHVDTDALPLSPTVQEAAHQQSGALEVFRLSSGMSIEKLQRTLAGRAFDQVEIHHPMFWPVLQTLDLRGALHRIYTAHVHAQEMDALRRVEHPTQSAMYEAEAFKDADLVVATSMAQFRRLRGRYPVLQGKLMCRKNRIAVQALPAPTPYAQRAVDIGLFSRFSDLKNTDVGLHAIAQLLAEHPDARAVVVGGIPDNPRTESKRWTAFLERCDPGVAERVDFQRWLPRDEALRVMADTRMVVAPSRVETWGLVVQEAMALGCCVVATPLPAHREQIEDGRTGVLTRDTSSEAVASRVTAVFKDAALQKRVSDAARTQWMAQASEG